MYTNNIEPEKNNMWVYIGAAIIIIYLIMNQSPEITTPEPIIENLTQSPVYTEAAVERYDAWLIDQEARGLPPTVNACNSTSFGFPDYDGTNKAGDTCADTVVSKQDLECLANPPKNYEGTIYLGGATSTPELTCCPTDGTCQW